MHKTGYADYCFNHSRMASLTRVCQPLPVARRAANTSLSNRMATCFLVAPAGRPRERRYSETPDCISFLDNGRSSSSLPSHAKYPPGGGDFIASSISSRVFKVVFEPFMVCLNRLSALVSGNTIKSPGSLGFAYAGAALPFKAEVLQARFRETGSLHNKDNEMSSIVYCRPKGISHSGHDRLKVRIGHMPRLIAAISNLKAVKAFPAYRTSQIAFGKLPLKIFRKIIIRQFDNIRRGVIRRRRTKRYNYTQSLSLYVTRRNDDNRSLFNNLRGDIASKIAHQNIAALGMPSDSGVFNLCRHLRNIAKTCADINLTNVCENRYYASRAGNSSAGIRTPNVTLADTPPAKAERFFCVRSMAASYERVMRGAERLAGFQSSRSSNPYGSLAPFERGAREDKPLTLEACHA